VVTARCSEVNVVVVPEPPAPGSAEDDSQGPEEHPVPEQFVSTFKAGKLVTVAASHSGA
jgi:adenylyl cyclase-associated protein